MDIETIREYCLGKDAAYECFPFDEDNLVFKVVDRMFLLINLNTPNRVSMKCDPDRALELRDRYTGIVGAYHFNKKYWNQLAQGDDLSDEMVRHLIDHSYDEVVKKLTRKQRESLERQSR